MIRAIPPLKESTFCGDSFAPDESYVGTKQLGHHFQPLWSSHFGLSKLLICQLTCQLFWLVIYSLMVAPIIAIWLLDIPSISILRRFVGTGPYHPTSDIVWYSPSDVAGHLFTSPSDHVVDDHGDCGNQGASGCVTFHTVTELSC